jgi:hypothetical protein
LSNNLSDKSLKFFEFLKDFRFVFEQINPSKLAKIINETNIIFIPSYGITGKTPYIRKNKLQRRLRNTK